MRIHYFWIAIFLMFCQVVLASEQKDHVGEIRCGERVIELDVAIWSNEGWILSDDALQQCGIIGDGAVKGNLRDGILFVEIDPARLVKRSIDVEGNVQKDFTHGETVWMFDWLGSASQPGGGSYLNFTAKYAESRVSAFMTTGIQSTINLGDVYWQERGNRFGQWSENGLLRGFQYGATVDNTNPIQVQNVGSFMAPVTGDHIRIVDVEGRTIQNIKTDGVGFYDLTSIAGNLPPGAQIHIDGKNYNPDIKKEIIPGQGISGFIGLRRTYDFFENEDKEYPYAFIRYPWNIGSGALYTTLANDGGRIESYFRINQFNVNANIFREVRGMGARLSATFMGISYSTFISNDEYQERAGGYGYQMITAGHRLKRGFVNASFTNFEYGASQSRIYFSYPISCCTISLEARREQADKKKNDIFFLSLSIPFGRNSIKTSTNGSMQLMASGNRWQAIAEREVYTDGRSSDSIYGQFEFNKARMFGRINTTSESVYISGAGRIILDDGLFSARQNGDAVLSIDAAPDAKVIIDGMVYGKTDDNGMFTTSITSGRAHDVRVVDDTESLVIIVNPEQTVRLLPGQHVKLKFDVEKME